MSKKNLAKTAIEGGRHSWSKWGRRHSNAAERAADREYCNRAKLDPESVDDHDIQPRDKAFKDFSDKLNPMFRWLAKQAGRLWDDVFSEICEKFDTRTTAGRHIVYDHLLHNVETSSNPRRYRWYSNTEDETTSHHKYDFYVDTEGILRHRTFIPRVHNDAKFDTVKLVKWLNNRLPGKVGEKMFWFVPATKNKKHRGYSDEWKIEWGVSYYSAYSGGLRWYYLGYDPVYGKDDDGKQVVVDRKPAWRSAYSPPSLRQDKEFSREDVLFWKKIPEFYQNKVLEYSPTNPNPPKPRWA